MHFQLLILLILFTLGLAAPTKQLTKRLQYFDNLPWKLSNIVAFESIANSIIPPFIDFDLEDSNSGLEENTRCRNTVPAGSNLTNTLYLPYSNNGMGFRYRGDSIWIHHFWRDPQCVKSKLNK
jgi:hypothetical protein